MGRLEREQRDERVKKEKMIYGTPFASFPLQTLMITKIKRPLLKLVAMFGDHFPEPTKENTWHPNSHHLIDLRDEFFRHCFIPNEERIKLLRIIFNFVIVIYDYDRPYRMMMDWCKEQLDRKQWAPRESEQPTKCNFNWWKE